MKCPNCGGEYTGEVCEYCGSSFPKEEQQPVIHITNHYYGEVAPGQGYENKVQTPKKTSVWWVLGWIFCFPIPLTVLLSRNKTMKPWVKYTLIAVLWIVVLCMGFASEDSSPETPTNLSSVTATNVANGEG